MASAANMLSGPADVKLADTAISHTQGGVTATITPQNRARSVDAFGGSELAIIHTGDQVRVTVPFAEYSAAVLAEIYNPGLDETASASDTDFLGIGRSAGFIYTTQDLKIVPKLSTAANKRIQFWKTTPIGQFEQVFDGGETDRILSVEFAALVDESKDDAELIGRLQLAAA